MAQFFLAIAVIVFALLVLNPMHLLMPTALAMLALTLFFVLFVLLGAFVLREQAGDERDEAHRAHAGRIAFVVGTALLVIGIIVQDLTAGAIDPWLVVALCAMLIAKLMSRAFSDRYR